MLCVELLFVSKTPFLICLIFIPLLNFPYSILHADNQQKYWQRYHRYHCQSGQSFSPRKDIGADVSDGGLFYEWRFGDHRHLHDHQICGANKAAVFINRLLKFAGDSFFRKMIKNLCLTAFQFIFLEQANHARIKIRSFFFWRVQSCLSPAKLTTFEDDMRRILEGIISDGWDADAVEAE